MKYFTFILFFTVSFGLAGKAQSLREVFPKTPLQQTVDRAFAGDTLFLKSGMHLSESVKITKPLVILGEPGTVLDGNHAGHVLWIQSDSVTLRGLEIRNAAISYVYDYAGIYVDSAAHVVIEDNMLRDTFFGVYLSNSHHVRVADNHIKAQSRREANSGNGIHIWYSRDVEIQGNTIEGHRDGIYFEFVKLITINENISKDNLRYGLHFMFSDDCSYTNNEFRNNGAGVAVMYTKHVKMQGNLFAENKGTATYGLLIKDIAESDITGNIFTGNSVGLFVEASGKNRIEGNEFSGNGWALKVMGNATGNVFEGNEFIENSFDLTTNSSRNANTYKRNYWAAYKGYDLDKDGVGDVPHYPVRLFGLMAEKQPQSLILLRSLFIEMLDAAERMFPVMTPQSLIDETPLMKRIKQ